MIVVELKRRPWKAIARNPCNFARHNHGHSYNRYQVGGPMWGPKFILEWPENFDTKEVGISEAIAGYHYLGFQLLAIKAFHDNDYTLYFDRYQECLDDLWKWLSDARCYNWHYKSMKDNEGWFKVSVDPMKLIYLMRSIEDVGRIIKQHKPIRYLADSAVGHLRAILHDKGPEDKHTDEFKQITDFHHKSTSLLEWCTEESEPMINVPQAREFASGGEGVRFPLTVLICEKIGFKTEPDAILHQASVIIDEQTPS